MKHPHLFWILIDSARNYQTDEDDRGLPQSVVDFAQESHFFKNVITSAPSTVQSISSMMTSSPSYLLARSYNNFRGQLSCFDYFPNMLKKEGYDVFGAIYFKHGREVMSNMFGMINKSYYPNNLSHRKEVWENRDVYNLFTNILDKHHWKNPTMCYLHFNVRVDVNISEVVQDTLDRIREKGLMDDSVVVINSDHGYPSADKNYNFEEGLKQGWGHDKYLTNDNILTPLVLHYPGVKPAVVEEYVATIDIVPTLCELMNITPSTKFRGGNILQPAEHLAKRLHRTDNRYIGQLPSFTSYILDQLKCIIEKDKNNYETYSFTSLLDDPKEQAYRSFSEEFGLFRQAILSDVQKLNNFHRDFLKECWGKSDKMPHANSLKTACIIMSSTPDFERITREALQIIYPEVTFNFTRDASSEEFDFAFAILESEVPWHFTTLKKLVAGVKSRKTLYLDNNGKVYSGFVGLKLYLEFFRKRIALVKHDKLFLLELIKRMFKKKLLNPIR